MKALFCALVASVALSVSVQAEERFVTIGTGGVTGVYYPAGGAIQRLVNRNTDTHGIRVSVLSTGGSIYNLNAMFVGELDAGVAQSDWHFHAFNGGHTHFPTAHPELRSLFSLHAEAITLVARADADIATLEDLPGKRINVGNPGSGQRATMDTVFEAMGWTADDFALISQLQSSEQAQALCDNNVDAIVFAAGHPNGSIQEAAATCDVVIVPVDSPEIDTLIEDRPYYAHATVPGGLYDGNPEDIPTFGVRATLVTTADLPDAAAFAIVEAVFSDFDRFIRRHPAFAMLDKEDMISAALTAPLHEGARQYYVEAGLLTEPADTPPEASEEPASDE